jgi:hypothetical protein
MEFPDTEFRKKKECRQIFQKRKELWIVGFEPGIKESTGWGNSEVGETVKRNHNQTLVSISIGALIPFIILHM